MSDGTDIIDAELIDDSKAVDGELATVVVSVWCTDKVARIESNVGKPLAFFNLMVKVTDDSNIVVNHYADAPLHEAPVSTKTNHSLAEAATLTAAQNANRRGYYASSQSRTCPTRRNSQASCQSTSAWT